MPPGKKKYLILNGHYYETGRPLFTPENRAFRYGDGLFETIRCHKTVPLFFEDHYNRLLRGMAILKMTAAGLPPIPVLKEHIEKLIVRNRIFYDARIRLSVFRRDGGLYTPETNSPAWLLEAFPLDDKGYHLNQEGIRIGVFTAYPKTWNFEAAFKTLSCTPYILAGIHKKENHWDDCLIINQDKKIIESISSNLFWVKNKVIHTPFISSGCVDGVMRKQVLKFAQENHIEIKESRGATEEELLDAEEIFLSNSVNGLRWVVAMGHKRYFNRLPKQIERWLNEKVKTLVSV
jgi:branched-subunit amino acid aminotransferase/4-amino-4-deoxychorismate lyase